MNRFFKEKITKKIGSLGISISLILLFWVLGEGIHRILDISFPGSLIGMLLLVLFMKLNVIKPRWILSGSDLLIRHMALFFIPPGLGIIANYLLIANNWYILLMIILLTMMITICFTVLAMSLKNKNR